jgi:hypothetical protein
MTLLAPPPPPSTTTPSIESGVVHYALSSPASSPYIAVSRRIVIETQAAPVWIDEVERRLNELLALGRGWDTYGAEPIQLEHVVSGLGLLQALAGTNSPMPFIAPTAARGIQFEWETDRSSVEARVDDEGICVYVRDDSGEAEGAPTPELIARASSSIAPAALVA